MRQSSFRYLAALDLLLVAAFLALFGLGSIGASLAVPAMLVAGVTALLAGTVATVSVGPVSVSWRAFAAATYLAFAVTMPAAFGPTGTASTADLAFLGVAAVGSLSMLYFAVGIWRGSDAFDVTEDVERTLSV